LVQTKEKRKAKKKPSTPIGSSSRPSQSGYDAEIIALDILKKEGFEISYSPVTVDRDRKKRVTVDLKTLISQQHRLERMGWSQYILNPIVESGKKKIYGPRSYHEIKYNPRPIADWLKQIPVSTPKEVELLKKQFWDREYKHRELCEIEKYQEELMLEVIGKSIIPKSKTKSIKERIDREQDPAWKLFWKSTLVFNNTFVDIFCKKNGRYYVVDVKFKNNQTIYEKNFFDITNYEVLNYPKILKEEKVGLYILVIVADGKKFRYALTEWSDFIIDPEYDPQEKSKTKVKMKNLIPFEKLLNL